MPWIVPAVLCAVFFGSQGIYVRYLHLKKISNPFLIFFAFFAFSLPVLIIPVLIKGIRIESGFFIPAIFAAVGNVIGFYSYVKALEFSDASLVLPILATSPLFTIPVSIFLLGEVPSGRAFLSIILIICGCYILTSGDRILEPIKKFKEEKGVRFAFLTVFVWAFVANIDKVALNHSDIYSYPFLASSLITIISLPLVYRYFKEINSKNFLALLGCGVLDAGVFLTHVWALALTKVAYLISVKRSGVLIGVLGGIIFFKEKEPAKRILAAGIILAGNVLLYLSR